MLAASSFKQQLQDDIAMDSKSIKFTMWIKMAACCGGSQEKIQAIYLYTCRMYINHAIRYTAKGNRAPESWINVHDSKVSRLLFRNWWLLLSEIRIGEVVNRILFAPPFLAHLILQIKYNFVV